MFVANLSGEFVAAGHESVILTLCDAEQLGNSREMEERLRRRIEEGGGRVVSLGLGRNRNPLAGAMAMRRAIRAIRPDIIHAHTARAMTMLVLRGSRAPVILTHHNSRLSFPTGLFLLFDRLVHSYVAISAETRTLFESHVRRPVAYIPNGTGSSFRAGAPRAAPGRPARILSVGAISHQKHYDLLIEVALMMREERLMEPLPLFRVAGNGPELETLRERVGQTGLDSQVQFLGERSDIAELMMESDLYLNTSRYEGLPVALLEAMGMGLPIVATDVPGNCELVLEGRNGKRAALDDPRALARAITALLTDHALYAHSSACALEQADDYTIGKAAERHLALYARATGNGG